MSIQTYARLLVVGGLVGTLACARNTEEDVSARRDTTTVADTARVMQDSAEAPPGYSGMERDTTQFPVDTAAAQGAGQDTSAYQQQDTSAYQQPDTSAYQQPDTSAYQQPDTSGYQQQPDTSGYQQPDTSAYQEYPSTDTTRMHTDSAHVNAPDSGGWSDTSSTSDSSSWSTGRDSTPR